MCLKFNRDFARRADFPAESTHCRYQAQLFQFRGVQLV